MPFFQAMSSRANAAFGPETINDVPPELFAPGENLVEGLKQLGVVQSELEAEFLARRPPTLKEAVRALLHENLRERKLPVTFAWAPGYEDELTLWEVADSDTSAGGITVFLRTRYPGDSSPIGGGGSG